MKALKLLIISILLMGISSCKKDKKIRPEKMQLEDITGLWFNFAGRNDTLHYYTTYNFKPGYSIEIITQAMDNNTNTTKGYVSYSTGQYRLKGDSVILKDLKTYAAHPYKKLEELKYISTTSEISYQGLLSADKRELRLVFECGPLMDCLFPTLFREKPE